MYAVRKPQTSHHNNCVLLTAVKSASLTFMPYSNKHHGFQGTSSRSMLTSTGDTQFSPALTIYSVLCLQQVWECPHWLLQHWSLILSMVRRRWSKSNKDPLWGCSPLDDKGHKKTSAQEKRSILAHVFRDIRSWSADFIPLDITDRRRMVVGACGKGCCSLPRNRDRWQIGRWMDR